MIKLKQFLDENPNISLLGFAWSCWWRLIATIYGIMFGIMFVIGMLSLMFE